MAASTNLTPEERSTRARNAALAMHAKRGEENVAKATAARVERLARLRRIEAVVDPDGVLTPAERERRIVAALTAAGQA